MGGDVFHLETVFSGKVDLPAVDKPLDLKGIPARGGVYAFADDAGGVIQTIHAQNIRRSVTLRLGAAAAEARSKRADLRAVARRLWWTPTYSVFESMLVYLGVARRLAPDTYRKELGFAPSWFASIRPPDRLPRWRCEKIVFDPEAVEVGPFARRKHCEEFIAILEDLFDLCREHHILDQTPNGRRCAYYDIGRCPAPCDGTIPLERYRSLIDDSVRFATHRGDGADAAMTARLREAAASRQYARAAHVQESADRALTLLHRDAGTGCTPGDFRYLVVQRGEKRSHVKPFFVVGHRIGAGESVPLKKTAGVLGGWIDRMRPGASRDAIDRARGSENIWLVNHFLAKGDAAAGLFVPADALLTADNLACLIAKRFRRPAAARPDNGGRGDSAVDLKP